MKEERRRGGEKERTRLKHLLPRITDQEVMEVIDDDRNGWLWMYRQIPMWPMVNLL